MAKGRAVRTARAAAALLNRVLHHAKTVVIEGKSYRMKNQIDPEPAA